VKLMNISLLSLLHLALRCSCFTGRRRVREMCAQSENHSYLQMSPSPSLQVKVKECKNDHLRSSNDSVVSMSGLICHVISFSCYCSRNCLPAIRKKTVTVTRDLSEFTAGEQIHVCLPLSSLCFHDMLPPKLLPRHVTWEEACIKQFLCSIHCILASDRSLMPHYHL
jgi:hypothetical protein